MLYSRYGSGAKDILSLPFEEGIEILSVAQRMNNEEKLFMRWAISYQTFMKYDQFKREVNVNENVNENVIDDRNEDEILDSVRVILGDRNGTEHI